MRTFTAILIALALVIIVDLPARGILAAVASILESAAWWVKPLIRQSLEVSIALILMVVINRGADFQKYGFRFTGNLSIWKSIIFAPVLFILSLIGRIVPHRVKTPSKLKRYNKTAWQKPRQRR